MKRLSCFYANVRSIVRNAVYIDRILSSSFDVYVFTETWLKSHHFISSLFDNMSREFLTIRCDRKRKAGGGVAILLKKNVGAVEVFSQSVVNSYEILSVDVFLEWCKLRLVAVYRAPSCNSEQNKQLIIAISDLVECEHPSVLLGDFNYPDISWPDFREPFSSDSACFVEMMRSHRLVQFVNEATRGSHILDLLLSSEKSFVDGVIVGPPVGLSDHRCVKFRLCCYYVEPNYTYARQFRRCDYNSACHFLSSFSWRNFLDSVTKVDEKYEMFISILKEAVELFVPWVRVEASHSYLPQYLQNMLDYRDFLFRLANGSSVADHWKKYTEFSGKFLQALKKYNANIEKRMLESGRKRNFYRFLSNKLRERDPIESIMKDDVVAVLDADKAEILADKFCEVFLDDTSELPTYIPEVSEPMGAVPWFDGKMLYELILSCSDSCSLTPDGIPSIFLKNIAHVIAGPLAYIFNQSLMFGEVPKRWKHSYVTPLLKKKPGSDINNYRPISITSILCRIFEKGIKSHLFEHLSRNGLIPDCQHGFVPKKSVETNMLECLNDWTYFLESKKACDVIYLDFSKAFDRVSHSNCFTD